MVQFVPVILILAAGCLGLGVFLPAVTVTNLTIFSDRFSIMEAVWQLLVEGEYLLSIVVFVFSVLFPMGKIVIAGILFRQIRGGARVNRNWIGGLEFFGRWSCMDILLIAIAVVVTKRTGIADAGMAFGLWFFAGSILLLAFATQLLKRRLALNSGDTTPQQGLADSGGALR